MARTLENRIARAIDKHNAKHPELTLSQIFEAFCSILDTLNEAREKADRPVLVLVNGHRVKPAGGEKIVRHHDEPQQDHPAPSRECHHPGIKCAHPNAD